MNEGFTLYSDLFFCVRPRSISSEKTILSISLIFSLTHFVQQIFDMASIRSISTSRPSERLLGRRLDRTSTSATPVSPRRITLSKTTSVTTSTSSGTSSRHRSSRTLSQKSTRGSATSPGNMSIYNPALPLDSLEITTNNLASTKLSDLAPLGASELTVVSLSRNHAESNGVINEQHTKVNEIFFDNNQFTLDSFDVIRTVGTGKHLLESRKRRRNAFVSLQELSVVFK